MKFHLPKPLFRALIACFASSVVLAGTSFAESAESVTYKTHQDGPLDISGNSAVIFENIQDGAISNLSEESTVLTLNDSILFCNDTASRQGGAIYNIGSFSMGNNGFVSFSGNTVCSDGGAIHNRGTFTLSENEDITFSGNSAVCGGAIDNGSIFTLSGNGDVSFSENTASNGGAILNEHGSTFTLSGNGDVSFSENTASNGGAILNEHGSTFTLSGNGDVSFSGNTGSAIYNDMFGHFSLSDNGDVSFSGNTGRAICNVWDGHFSLSDNGDVSFSGNTGGAIANEGPGIFTLSGNGKVTFCGNSTSYGGAIRNVDGDGTAIFLLIGNGDVTFISNTASYADGSSGALGGAIANAYGTFTLSGNGNVSFIENTASRGGAIYNADYATFTLSGNGDVTFSGNTASSGGAICNWGNTFTLSNNGDITFSENTASDYGGAINNYGTFTLSNNGDVTFCKNKAFSDGYEDARGGAIYNCGTFELCGNASVTFSENSSSSGGAIFNEDNGPVSLRGNGDVTFNKNMASGSGGAIHSCWCDFTLSNNRNVTFIGNVASDNGGAIEHNLSGFLLRDNEDVLFCGNTTYGNGGAIYNGAGGTFTLSNNGDVVFEKNAEISNGVYRLRSLYSAQSEWGGDTPTLNLSASENHSILFRDSIYAEGIVNLNQDGTGDIIFSGATTEVDLREVKGGIDGTAEEILNSRTSEIATNAKLYGGRLIVEDGAILKGQGITVMENANATIRLNNATLDETGYTIAVSSGSGLEFEGENTLKAASVQLADGANLSFVMGDGNGTDWDAQLITGQLNVQVSGDLFNEHRLLTLHDGSQYDTSLWTSDAITVSGTTFDSLSWNAGVLTYTPHVIEAEEDGTFDDKLPDNGNAIIDGNGHSLTVKNAVQLVQMALKNGTVKLEGENNNVVSVTLTEDGTLVLTAGAGLKTGDIISMVASGKGELVISGDITLDEHGMKGKAGSMASVSNMSATTTGDAVFENVAFTDSLLDIGEGTTATFRNAVLGAGTRVTDAPATAKFENTLALLDSTNTEVVTESTTAEALQLYMSGDTANAVTLDAGAALVDLTCTVFDTITLSGSDLYLDLTALAVALGDADAFSLTFSNGTLAAIDADSLHIYATLDGEHYLAGYTTQQGGLAEKVYFTTSASVPEPATATLSLLALAALTARRKRKA